MYRLTRFINKKAIIYDSVQGVRLNFDFDSISDAEAFIIAKNKEILKKNLASYRYTKEVEGVNFGGVVISTDREAQAQFNSAYSAMKEGLAESITWKGDGNWVEIDLALAKDISMMLVMHVQKCFKCEKSISDDIDKLNTIPDIEAFDISAMWNARYESL